MRPNPNLPRIRDLRPDVFLVQRLVFGQLKLAGVGEDVAWRIKRPDGWLLLDLPR